MKHAVPFSELGFTRKCAIVEMTDNDAVDGDYQSFVQHQKNRSAQKARDRKKILAGIMKLNERNNHE